MCKKYLTDTLQYFNILLDQNWSNYKVYMHIIKHNYKLGGMLFTICKGQLHFFGHKCWPSSGCKMKNYQSVIRASVGDVEGPYHLIYSCVWRCTHIPYNMIYSKYNGDDAPHNWSELYFSFSVLAIYFYRLNSNIKERPFPQFTVYIIVVYPEDGRSCRQKHVVYVMNKWMSEHL